MIAQRWQALLEKYDALSQRERGLIAAALIGGVLLIGNSIFIDLPLARAKLLGKQTLAEQGELATLQLQIASLQRDMRDPDEDNRARLATINRDLQVQRSALAEHQRLLVSPQDIPQLLERLLARHAALRLISMRSLPAQPANAPKVEEDATKPAEAGKAVAKPRADGVEVWKHGVELRVQGSYADLTSYLSELERLPQRLIWGEVRLKAEYPRSELHLKIYTYSLDQAWLRL